MGFYENKRDGTVLRALKKRGFKAELRYQNNDVHNPRTGEVTEGADKKITVYALDTSSMNKRQNPLDQSKDTLLEVKKRTLMITATGVPTPPDIDDMLKIGGLWVSPMEIIS